MNDTQSDTPLTENQIAFLAAYSEAFGQIAIASKAAGITRSNHSRWLGESESYRDEFERAKQIAIENLELTARKRAVEGSRKYKFFKGEPILHPITGEPYFEVEFSETLMKTLLKAHIPERYRENREPLPAEQEVIELPGLDKMSVDELLEVERVLRKLQTKPKENQ